MSYPAFDSTIVAIATPLGTGGVGIIRISGNKALEILQKIFKKTPKNDKKVEFLPNFATHGWIVDGNTLLDEVIAIYFKAPNSYTGEDTVEINCHGGVRVLNNILNLILKNGAELAQRGENLRPLMKNIAGIFAYSTEAFSKFVMSSFNPFVISGINGTLSPVIF